MKKSAFLQGGKPPKDFVRQSRTKAKYSPETNQLGLFTAPKPDLIVKPVDQKLALADDRYFLVYGTWHAAIQLTLEEAYQVLEQLSGFDWTLDDRGVPVKQDAIYGAIDRFLMGGAE